MKKFFIGAALVIAAATFSSCNPDAIQCWKITVSFQTGTTQVYYFWGDGMQSDAQLETYQRLPGIKSVSKEQTFLSESDCKVVQ